MKHIAKRVICTLLILAAATPLYAATALDPAEEQFYKTFGELKTKVKLRPQDEKANQIAAKNAEGKDSPMPVAGRNGSVQHHFDGSVPRVFCKPLRVTDIELEPGENIVNAPFIGDSVNWSVLPSASGSGNNLTYHIIVKPNMPDINTNLIVHTDRRTYQFDLVSDKKNHTPKVTFSYPQQNEESWDTFFAAMGERDPRKKLIQREQEVYGTELPAGRPNTAASTVNRNPKTTPVPNRELNFNYKIIPRHKGIEWVPLRAYDNGLKTYIDMPDNLASIEAPVFMVLSPAGSREMVNYRLVDKTYVIDRLVKRGVLIAGAGHDAREVVIVNMGTKSRTQPAKQKVLRSKEDIINYLKNGSTSGSEDECFTYQDYKRSKR